MSRKGGRGAYDEKDSRYDDDDYYSEEDYDYDDDDGGYDAYDPGGGGATLSAKASKNKKPPVIPPKKKPPAAKQVAKGKQTGAAPAKVEGPPPSSAAATSSAAAAAALVAPQLGSLALSDATSAAPYSHPKELAAALEERAKLMKAAAGSEPQNSDSDKAELHVVVLGHVDAGKSTLAGRLLADCGVVKPRDAAKIAAEASKAGKGSFSWAWLLDATEDERQRGMTVEVGRCRVSTPRLHVTLLDAPGHADFVPEAIGGVAVADAALLVVDGSRGGFEAGFDGNKNNNPPSSSSSKTATTAGQTKEHAALARALGVRELIVAVTKLDTLEYSRDRFEEIRARLGAFLSSLGFGGSLNSSSSSSSPPSSRPVTWLPVSAPAGQNVSAPPTDPLLLSWWDGATDVDSRPTLLAALGRLSPPERSVDSALRLPAADVSPRPPRAGQACTLLSGKVEAGALCPGMKVVAVPPGGAAGMGRVVSVVVRGGGGGGGGDGGTTAATVGSLSSVAAVAGDSCEVVVSGPLAEPGVLGRGAVLCPASHPVALAKKFVARIKLLDGAGGGGGGGGAAAAAAAAFAPTSLSSSSPGAAGIILPGSSVTLHVGGAVRPATITRLVALLDPRTGEEVRKRPRLIGRGQAALVEVAPEGGGGDAVAVVAASSPSPSSSSEVVSILSRIALREAGKTLAVGVVVEVVE